MATTKQTYKGNGNHEWELVHTDGLAGGDTTRRLRVPGGWIYQNKIRGQGIASTVFVPMPEVVGKPI